MGNVLCATPEVVLLRSSKESGPTILQDYSACELQVVVGEVLTIEDARHKSLLVCNQNGKRGWAATVP